MSSTRGKSSKERRALDQLEAERKVLVERLAQLKLEASHKSTDPAYHEYITGVRPRPAPGCKSFDETTLQDLIELHSRIFPGFSGTFDIVEGSGHHCVRVTPSHDHIHQYPTPSLFIEEEGLTIFLRFSGMVLVAMGDWIAQHNSLSLISVEGSHLLEATYQQSLQPFVNQDNAHNPSTRGLRTLTLKPTEPPVPTTTMEAFLSSLEEVKYSAAGAVEIERSVLAFLDQESPSEQLGLHIVEEDAIRSEDVDDMRKLLDLICFGRPFSDPTEVSTGKKAPWSVPPHDHGRGADLAKDVSIPGITSSHGYAALSDLWTVSAAHREHMELPTEIVMRAGAPKCVITVPPRATEELHAQLEGFITSEHVKPYSIDCVQQLRHANLMLSPSWLTSHNIPFSTAVQYPGDIIVTSAQSVHQAINTGKNYATACAALTLVSDNNDVISGCHCVQYKEQLLLRIKDAVGRADPSAGGAIEKLLEENRRVAPGVTFAEYMSLIAS